MTVQDVHSSSVERVFHRIESGCNKEKESVALPPPQAKKIRTVHKLHGDTRADDYHWLRDKEDSDTIQYLKDWNTYTGSQLEPLNPLVDKLYSEFESRVAPNDKSVPYQIGNHYYYTRKVEGKEYSIYCQSTSDDDEVVILDGNIEAENHEHFEVMNYEPSPNGEYVAFMIDTTGTQYGDIHIMDMKTKQFIKSEVIKESDGNFVWNADSTGLWYVQVNEEKRSDKLRYHTLGNYPKVDTLIYEEKDTLFDIGIKKDKTEQTLFVTSHAKESTEVRTVELNFPNYLLDIVSEKSEHFLYSIIPGKETHYITVTEGNKNAALMKVDAHDMSKENWEMVIPSDPHREIEQVTVMKDFVAMVIRENGLMKVEILSRKDNSSHQVKLPQDICEVYFGYNATYDTNKLRFIFNSPVNPTTTFLYDMSTRELETLKVEFAGDFDPSEYTTERIMAPADDGTMIPISLFYKKGILGSNPQPTYLYGYGSYGHTIDPYFSRTTASFLKRGVCCAIAHTRGSGYYGRDWYEKGKLLHKNNTFTDFINCAEHLVKKGVTSPDKLVIRGGSAGGLLMGAVINMRPDLFKACVALVPFVDVVTTMLDESLPLTTQEREEWGDPRKPKDYEYMLSYSPVDNVRAQDYPNLYVKGGLNDAQVSYHEPAKWVAKLLDFKTDDNKLLFHTNMGAGHHGDSGRYKRLKECAPYFAFMLDQLGYSS